MSTFTSCYYSNTNLYSNKYLNYEEMIEISGLEQREVVRIYDEECSMCGYYQDEEKEDDERGKFS